MPALLNSRHEKFAQELAKGASASEAMKAAGFKSDRRNGTRLTTNEDIRRRVDELKERAATNVVLSREWVLEELIDNAKRAKEGGDYAPSNKALELLGKEIGMFVERTENVNINHDVSDKPLTEDEWASEAPTAH